MVFAYSSLSPSMFFADLSTFLFTCRYLRPEAFFPVALCQLPTSEMRGSSNSFCGWQFNPGWIYILLYHLEARIYILLNSTLHWKLSSLLKRNKQTPKLKTKAAWESTDKCNVLNYSERLGIITQTDQKWSFCIHIGETNTPFC